MANNIGKTSLLGESHYLGNPMPDPERATTMFSYAPLPSGTVLTLQGVMIDPASAGTKAVSATNAVIVRVQ